MNNIHGIIQSFPATAADDNLENVMLCYAFFISIWCEMALYRNTV